MSSDAASNGLAVVFASGMLVFLTLLTALVPMFLLGSSALPLFVGSGVRDNKMRTALFAVFLISIPNCILAVFNCMAFWGVYPSGLFGLILPKHFYLACFPGEILLTILGFQLMKLVDFRVEGTLN